MSYFRKRPVIVEAARWLGPDTELPFSVYGGRVITEGLVGAPRHYYKLPSGALVRAGEWIVKKEGGVFDACGNDIFAATYEPADPDAASDPMPPAAP